MIVNIVLPDTLCCVCVCDCLRVCACFYVYLSIGTPKTTPGLIPGGRTPMARTPAARNSFLKHVHNQLAYLFTAFVICCQAIPSWRRPRTWSPSQRHRHPLSFVHISCILCLLSGKHLNINFFAPYLCIDSSYGWRESCSSHVWLRRCHSTSYACRRKNERFLDCIWVV